MKRLLLFLLPAFLLFFTPSKAQTCGVQSVIQIYGGTASVTYAADTSGFLPGWNAYAYEWNVNNSLFSTQSAFLEWLPSGFNLVCLKVYGTNASTGDSCIAEYCNVFQSTGDAIYPYFDVSVNGLTVDFNGGYYGGNSFSPDVTYDFGDGSTYSGTSLFTSHTYATPGYYSVYIYVQTYDPVTGMANGQINRYINVGNGFGNLEISNTSDVTVCDSVSLSVNSTPPFTTGTVITNMSGMSSTLNTSSPTPVEFNDVPGHDFLQVVAFAPNNQEDVKPHLAFLNDCGFIPDTITGSVYEDINFNGLRDAGEPGISGKIITVTGYTNSTTFSSVDASYHAVTDANGNYSILVPHHSVSVALYSLGGYTLTFPAATNYNVNFNSGTSHPGYNWGLSALSTTICGITYLDDDQNGSYTSSSDRIIPNVNISVLNTITGLEYHTLSGTSGNYCIELPPGNFTVKAAYALLDSATVAPDSIIVNSPSGGTFNNNPFGFTSPVPVNFESTLGCIDPPRPGFDIVLTARITNRGFVNGKGTVVMQYDPALTFLSAAPANGIVNTFNHTITWTTDTIKTGTQVHFSATFNIPVSVPLGTLLLNSVSVTALPGFTENTLSDNNDDLMLTVIGSYDPNDKKVDPAGAHAGGEVHHDTRLNYRIRFQNTGTASAINVIVTDTIDDDLDLSTFMMHNASHNYQLVTNDRIVVWKFFNINLPDSNSNEPDSHGFIEYSIKPVQGLADGTTIENSANIYFDFNAPVITNTTLNTLQTTIVSIEEIENSVSLMAFPNPAGDHLNLQPRASTGNLRITLYDITGKKIRTLYEGMHTEGKTLPADLSSLERGMYIIQMEHADGNDVVRVVRH